MTDFLDNTDFDGETYIPAFDAERLGRQLKAVYQLIRDNQWHDANEIDATCPGRPTGISSRVRDFRKEQFGNFLVESRRKGDPKSGLWEWRLGPQIPVQKKVTPIVLPGHRLTLQDRVEAYKAAFPQYPDSWPWVSATGRWLNAVWLGGENYKGSGYYGAYPPWYLPRLAALFPDIPREEWLHLYAGSLDDETPGWKLELRPPGDGVAPAHVRADCRHLPFQPATFRFTAADPPYTDLDAERYHTPAGLHKPLVVRECALVSQPGGFLAWLDTTLPIYRGEEWRHFGMICVQRSCNHRTRLCSLFERV